MSNIRAYLDLYSEYFGHLEYGDVTSDFTSVVCPFHDDHNASAGISKKTGVFNCHVCGAFSPAQFIAKSEGITEKEAYARVDKFRSDEGMIVKDDTGMSNKLPMPNKRWKGLYEQSQEFITPDLHIVREYMAARNISYETLRHFKVGYLPSGTPSKRDSKGVVIAEGEYTHWGRESLVFPYMMNSAVVGLRYRDISMNKTGETGSHFMLWGLDELPEETDVVVILEGETDCMRTWEALGGKYFVTCSPGSQFRHEWKRELEGVSQVIIIPQADEAAEKFIKGARATIETLTVLNLPWRRKQFGNDVADWLRYHEDSELCEMIDAVAEASTRRVLSGFEFATIANKPRNWLIEGLLARRQVGLIGGPPKANKTWFALNIVRSLLSKEPLCGIPSLKPPADAPIPHILIIEEEGDIEGLHERVKWVLDDLPWKENTYWAHHLGVKLDTDVWITRLEKEIEANKIDLLIIDPFHRTYSVDEDRATEMGKVWDRIIQLTTRFKNLSILILHHFTKSGGVEGGWASFRGSSRTAAEADLGIFMEARPKSKGGGALMKIDGRSIPTPVTCDGKDVWTLEFSKGILTAQDLKSSTSKGGALFNYIKDNGEIPLTQASNHFKVSVNTITVWVQKSKNNHTDTPLMVIEGDPKIVRLYENRKEGPNTA